MWFLLTFTTGSMTKDLEALRAGLYGLGPFSQLKKQFPVEDLHLWTRAELDKNNEVAESLKEDRFLPGACSGLGLSKFWQVRGEWEANLCALEADFSSMSMIFVVRLQLQICFTTVMRALEQHPPIPKLQMSVGKSMRIEDA